MRRKQGGSPLGSEEVPVSDELREAARLLKREPEEFFLRDSDDYQLIIACGAKDVDPIRAAIALTYNGPVTEVGQVTAPDKGIRLLLPDGSEQSSLRKRLGSFSVRKNPPCSPFSKGGNRYEYAL